ncbi:MAG: 3'-5' exonuclease [Psychrobium sp.]|nr:3'-5' exonuclease [Psychrobium sp.]
MSTKLSFRWLNRWLLGLKAKHQTAINYMAQPSDLSGSIAQSELLSIDLEMTGLNPKKHEVISMAWVPIINGEIVLSQAQTLLIKADNGVGDSAIIHGIVDSDLKHAVSLAQGLEQLLQAMQGRVLVAHHGALDIAFLQQGAQKVYGHKLSFQLLDTLLLESKRLSRQGEHFDKQLLRLHRCCERYHLPALRAHNALSDALATAQLLLAQSAVIGGAQPLTLKQLMKYSH